MFHILQLTPTDHRPGDSDSGPGDPRPQKVIIIYAHKCTIHTLMCIHAHTHRYQAQEEQGAETQTDEVMPREREWGTE